MGYQDPDVEDLVQETFLRAFKALDGWKAQRELYSWLNKICVNLCFKAMRRRRKEQLMAAEGLEAAARSVALERERQAEQADAKRSALETVKQALQQLDGKCRQIVALRDLDGRSYSDIALTLKLAPGTVFSRLARCREALRQLVLGQGREGSGRG